jgi:hypothetical protein
MANLVAVRSAIRDLEVKGTGRWQCDISIHVPPEVPLTSDKLPW